MNTHDKHDKGITEIERVYIWDNGILRDMVVSVDLASNIYLRIDYPRLIGQSINIP